MTKPEKTYRLFLSAAEPSADSHCAKLITALKQSTYDIECVGLGGPKMAAAGCHLLEDTVSKAAMLYNAFTRILHYYRIIRRAKSYLKSTNVDLVIVCDSPAFNFHIAKNAKKANIKTLFYVAPQLWAWGAWRIAKLRKYCHKLCCILPFEQNWFASRGIDAVFVGNPMLENNGPNSLATPRQYIDFDPQNAHIALMPGSRDAEIKSLWPAMQHIAIRLSRRYRNARFTAVAVDEARKKALNLMQIRNFSCQYEVGSVAQTASNADFAIVASGSATLQVAAAGCPMVVMYQSSPILWHLIGRWLIKSRHLSLVNILAGKELVPEFMPYFRSIDPIVQRIHSLLDNPDALRKVSADLVEAVQPLAAFNASENVVAIVSQMLEA